MLGFKESKMPFGLQPVHLIVVAVVALLIFGPARLPEIGRGIGKAITEFRRGAKEMGGSFMEEVNQPIEPPTSNNISQSAVPTTTMPTTSVPISSSESTASTNFCIHCGKANPVGAVFCNHCGFKIAE
jgi:sec-independent protein translocase protein TatA